MKILRKDCNQITTFKFCGYHAILTVLFFVPNSIVNCLIISMFLKTAVKSNQYSVVREVYKFRMQYHVNFFRQDFVDLLSELPLEKRKELLNSKKSDRKAAVQKWRNGQIDNVSAYKKNWFLMPSLTIDEAKAAQVNITVCTLDHLSTAIV